VFTIAPTSALPAVPAGTTIDGESQINFTGSTNAGGPVIVLNGARVTTPAPGLALNESNCVIHDLVISGFSSGGILISGVQASGNVITGCYIGTDAIGASAVANAVAGIKIASGAHGNTIGSTAAADRNVISGNSGCGVIITDAGSDSNTIAGNFIGLGAGGQTGVPNALQGVAIMNGSQSNDVGGAAIGASNRIWQNGKEGITISGATTIKNTVSQNSIYKNGGQGIVLVSSANGQLPVPILSSAKAGATDANAGGTDIVGSVKNMPPNTSFLVEFFANPTADPSGFGQGQTFIGSLTLVTDSNGSRSFTASVPAAVRVGYFVTAVTTDSNGNTSSFSQARATTIQDNDADGMPDKYESANQLDPKKATDANLDSDGDGMINLQEYYAGTNPRSGASVLKISSIDFSGGMPRIGFQSVAGKTYRVEYSQGTGSGSWSVLANNIYTSSSTTVQVTDRAGLTQRVYRVVIDQ